MLANITCKKRMKEQLRRQGDGRFQWRRWNLQIQYDGRYKINLIIPGNSLKILNPRALSKPWLLKGYNQARASCIFISISVYLVPMAYVCVYCGVSVCVFLSGTSGGNLICKLFPFYTFSLTLLRYSLALKNAFFYGEP